MRVENKYRNEMLIELGGEKILLRPTFENVQAMEANVGGFSYLAYKFSRGLNLEKGAKVNTEDAIKSLPALTECAQIIYYNQAERDPEDPIKRKRSLEEIWELVVSSGLEAPKLVVGFLGRVVAGNKFEEVTEEDLKESSAKAKSHRKTKGFRGTNS